MAGERVEGWASVLSNSGTSKWATITPPMPWSKACWNGANSTESNLALSCKMDGRVA